MHQTTNFLLVPLTVAAALEGMANTVLLIGEWLLKQQQQLARQASLLEEKQSQISEQQKQIEELTSTLVIASKPFFEK